MCYCYFPFTTVSTVLGRVTLIVYVRVWHALHMLRLRSCGKPSWIDRLLRSAIVPDNFPVLSHPAAVKVLPDCFRVYIPSHPLGAADEIVTTMYVCMHDVCMYVLFLVLGSVCGSS